MKDIKALFHCHFYCFISEENIFVGNYIALTGTSVLSAIISELLKAKILQKNVAEHEYMRQTL